MLLIDLQDKLQVGFVHAVVHGEAKSTAGNLTAPAHGLERSSAGALSSSNCYHGFDQCLLAVS